MINDKFLWGVSTSAGQIEGSILSDGRGLSIWDIFSFTPKNIKNGDTPITACDSYLKWKDDVKLLKDLGVNSYRFSVSWSRVFPEGKDKINRKGLDYYKRLTDTLKNEGVSPNVTLYHWDLPYELQKNGGFVDPDFPDIFADYAQTVFKELDGADFFSTFNEPIAVYIGYANTFFAPGLNSEELGRKANHNLLLAHGKAVERFRSLNLKSDIGIVIDVWNRIPLDKDDEKDVQFAERENALAHGSFLSPIFLGKYDEHVIKHLNDCGIKINIKDEDLKLISSPLDFYGLNCYNRIVVSASNKDVKKELAKQGGNFLQNGNEYYPNAIYDAVKIVRNKYGVKIPILITENGVGFTNECEENGLIVDDERIKYLSASLNSVKKLNAEGYDVRGYYLWSLMDNFEWTAGYEMKFGIFTRNRKPKKSAYFYNNYIKNNIKG